MRAALATIGIVVYLAGTFLTFLLVHGTDYNAQVSTPKGWLLTLGDAGMALLWPVLLVWFVLAVVINIWRGVP